MAKNSAWVEENSRIIAKRREEHTLSDVEFEAFQSIIRQAQAGDWSAAQDEVMRLAKAQSSTP